MLDAICQVGVAVFGLTAIVLVARENRWGFVFGLACQPFWFTIFLRQEGNQLGAIVLTCAYTLSWIYGIRKRFGKRKQLIKKEGGG